MESQALRKQIGMRLILDPEKDIPIEGKSTCVHMPDGSEVALFKIEGQIHACHNKCPHQGGPLCEGEVEEGKVTCPWHGWQFNLSSGLCENQIGEELQMYHVINEKGTWWLTTEELPN